MAQEIHVTSAAIRSVRTEIGDDLIPEIRELRDMVRSTDLEDTGPDLLRPLGWGAAGEPIIGIRYREIQRDVVHKFDDALEVLDTWLELLERAERNWRTAESRSVVVYR
ncbi:hypothetical protein GCM10027187_16580 [Streptosporangium sandarakinum]|uniref:Uncharacterized protein n=1 Tax=Streptosporangium sandarakinum TaxID=1260955 RepID=A0A852V5D6_9ACTN|nr:hypothetical protein [Streptosporangium sandarakinum]NYF42384.1 hypothetical protein [Streptosporangium sandarakinum]